MNGKNKYYYQMPNATLNLSSNNESENAVRFRTLVRESRKSLPASNPTPSLSPSVSRAGFFGGIYENIQTYIGLKK
jgi:hypothetical protein